MVNRKDYALAVVGGDLDGFLPFHYAASRDASLDAIFYLPQQCPSALRRIRFDGGNADTCFACGGRKGWI